MSISCINTLIETPFHNQFHADTRYEFTTECAEFAKDCSAFSSSFVVKN